MVDQNSQNGRSAGKTGKSIAMGRVIQFFLNLYRLQLGVSRTVANRVDARAIPLPPGASGADAAYELCIKYDDQRKTRRMTIGMASGITGSKSTCFKVTYDDLLVVKVPPHPIKSLKQYVEKIHLEQHIADLLQPEIDCITPGVAAILGRIPRFYERDSLHPDVLEKRYLARLEKFPKLQKYLMIGDSFAFFMNLSKHLFVDGVIRKLHAVGETLQDEIAKNTDTLWRLEAFHERYGMENTPAFFHINEVLTACDPVVTALLEKHGLAPQLPAYTRKQWPLNYLAGMPFEKGGLNFPDLFFDELRAALKNVLNTHGKALHSFRKTIRAYLRNKQQGQNAKHLEGLITGLLELLTRLNTAQVAIRDLKPENIFLVSQSEQSSAVRAWENEYRLGLIDFETAVNLNPVQSTALSQPMLAGTPYYSTPAHIFENTILKNLYPDVKRILHMQDWYAVMAMLFEVVVGRRLFIKTGRTVPIIIRVKQEKTGVGVPPAKIYTLTSRFFWKTAREEFRQNVAARGKFLKVIRPGYTENTAKMLLDEARLSRKQIITVIRDRIDTQRQFISPADRQFLERASAIGTKGYRFKWLNSPEAATMAPAVQARIIHFLKQVESDKARLDNLQKAEDFLKPKPLKLSVLKLLEIMFEIISGSMSRFSAPVSGRKNKSAE